MLNNNLYTVINIKKFWSEFGESLEDESDASMDNVFRTNFIDIFHVPIRMEFANIGDFLEEAVIYELTNACMKRNGLEALNFQYKMNYNRSTNFEYTTETIMFYTRCYTQYGLFSTNFNTKH